MKVNYNDKYLDIVNSLNYKPRLLLHSCCAPCSSYVLSLVCLHFDVTVIYYNPNIYPVDEYNKRKMEQIRFIERFNKDNNTNIKFIDCDYDGDSFELISKGLENAKEGGSRCYKCYELRLRKTALMANSMSFDYFGTTLSVSPYKNSEWINEIGKLLGVEYKVSYLYGDFKKNDGYKKSILLSSKYNLYRQSYCGCKYSLKV